MHNMKTNQAMFTARSANFPTKENEHTPRSTNYLTNSLYQIVPTYYIKSTCIACKRNKPREKIIDRHKVQKKLLINIS